MPRQKGSPVLENLDRVDNLSVAKEIDVKEIALVQLAYCLLTILVLLITDGKKTSSQIPTAP